MTAYMLSGKQLGVAFRRQVVVGRFIVDFLAPSVRLVVEVDGGCHAARRGSHARRDGALRRAGYRVVRVSAELVRERPGEVVAWVRRGWQREAERACV